MLNLVAAQNLDTNNILIISQRMATNAEVYISRHRKTMTNLGTKLEEYWKEMCHRRKTENPNSTTPVEDTLLVHFAVADILHSPHVCVWAAHMLWYSSTSMSSGSAQTRTGCSARNVCAGANSQTGSTAKSCWMNGSATGTRILSSGEHSYRKDLFVICCDELHQCRSVFVKTTN